MQYPCGHSCLTEPFPIRCPLCHKSRGHKYGAKPVRSDEHGYFASTGEYLRYLQLLTLLHDGQIKSLARQVTYWIKSIKQNAVWDFRYKERINGRWKTIIEDFKGHRTREYRHKRRWFEHDYPKLVFRETTAKVTRKGCRSRQGGA